MAQGHLRVTIVEAAKLVDKDKTDFNDPYVEVYIDEKKKQKTGTLLNVERPVWNETFDLYVMIFFFVLSYSNSIFLRSDLWPSNEYVYIDVYDEDEGEKPDFIGSVKISLDDVIKKGHFDDWVKLPGFLGFGSRGDVHIRMTFEQNSTD
jgi:Ca2+-dependent lipid-binding protein